MGFIFLMILVIGILYMVMPPPGSSNTKSNSCPPHKWEYDSTGFLYCLECKQRPGYEGRE